MAGYRDNQYPDEFVVIPGSNMIFKPVRKISGPQTGRTYDAYKAIRGIVTRAASKLIIVDSYIDSTIFTLLENAQPNLKIQILKKRLCLISYSSLNLKIV